MLEARSYEDWKRWAIEEDRRSGADRWKDVEESSLYDYEVIRLRYDELVEIRRSGDPHRLVYYLNEGLHGNMGGMGSPALYAQAKFGTKTLVTRYIDEVVAALHDLDELDERAVDSAEKLELLERSQECFGRSALMLSGAGSLGAFHLGVAKALSEHDLVPKVISGASAGSMVAAILGSHPVRDLPKLFSEGRVAESFAALRGGEESSARRRRIRIENLRAMIEHVIPDLTFAEAFEVTGRHINVAVAPAKLHQRSRLLNASTAPNAFLREAVEASCAVPGIFPPVTLAAKDASGQRRPYVPSRQWIDGSITDDLPARRIARMYGVNHFISSQANPIVLWASHDPHSKGNLLSRFTAIYLTASQDWMRALYPFAMSVVRDRHPLSRYTRLLFSIATQDYSADIHITPSRRFFEPSMLLSALSDEEAHALALDGERSTWPKIEIIRNCTKVSRAIDGLLEHYR